MEECEKEPELKVCAWRQLNFITLYGTQRACLLFGGSLHYVSSHVCANKRNEATVTCLFHVSGLSEIIEGCYVFKTFLMAISFPVFEEFEEKCESTGKAGFSGVGFMSGSQLVPWE